MSTLPALARGTVAAGWQTVANDFARMLEADPQSGSALAVYVKGELVVDLWGGPADVDFDVPWGRSTATPVFSCTKGLLALLGARRVERGQLDYDARVADYWPEFGQAGKSAVTVGDLLAHRAGLPAVRGALTVDDIVDWDAMVARLESTAPLWEPGSAHSYHAITYGWLVGELLARVTGTTLHELFRNEISEGLSAEVWLGFTDPPTDIASVLATPSQHEAARSMGANPVGWALAGHTLGGALPAVLAGAGEGFDDPRIQRAGLAGAGAVATARGLAKVWSSVASPRSSAAFVGAETLARALAVRSEGPQAAGGAAPWGRFGCGFQLASGAQRYLTEASFGHDGAGGQVAFADPMNEVGFAYVTNAMYGGADDRGAALVRSVARTLEYAEAVSALAD